MNSLIIIYFIVGTGVSIWLLTTFKRHPQLSPRWVAQLPELWPVLIALWPICLAVRLRNMDRDRKRK